jgi:hypothetical protein
MKAVVALAILVAPLAAQTGEVGTAPPGQTVVRAPGARYRAGALHRFLLGREYRELWTTPITVPVLDLDTLAGGLRPLGRTGGQQTRTLKLGTRDGQQFFLRPIDKDPSLALPAELRGTVAERVVQDQISSAFPLGPVVVDRLIAAAGVLHGTPRLVILPDDAALGEFRADFAGLMGFLDERVGGSWHGATEIIGSDTLFVRLDRNSDDRVDARAFLVARLFDVFIGDWDRHRGQWLWARFDDALPRRWLPIPLDRDQAFVKYDGLLLGIARQSVPQLVNFGSRYADMVGQTWNGRELDRRFLVELPRPVWDSVARALQAALSDSVIGDAVGALPPEHYALIGKALQAWLMHRRDALPKAAGRFFDILAGQVEVHGTDGSDVAALTRAPDGSVTVALSRASESPTSPYFERRFEPRQTREVRLFLGQGDDTAVVRGVGGGILLRVLGDFGRDQLADSSRGGRNRFYDADAEPDRTTGHAGAIDRRPYAPPPSGNPHALPPRDWGHRWQPLTWVSFGPDLGLFIGGGRALTVYGFRKYPFASRHRFRAGLATGPPTYRVDYRAEFHRENSKVSAELFARASGIDVVRFHGFGNETSITGNNAYYRVTQDQFSIAPSLMLPLGPPLTLALGPTLKYVSTDHRPGRFLATVNPYGSGEFGELGAQVSLLLDTRNRGTAATHGLAIELGGAVHPAWWDVREAFGEAHGEAAVYLSPPAPLDPTLSLRVGGKKLWGAYPFFDAAFIGGRSTVRLGRENRYAGDASAYGSAELRLALAHALLVVPAELGIFGLADAGRVFYAGESSTTWHTAFGGGVWTAFLNRANTISVAIAASEERTAVYVQAGLGF